MQTTGCLPHREQSWHPAVWLFSTKSIVTTNPPSLLAIYFKTPDLTEYTKNTHYERLLTKLRSLLRTHFAVTMRLCLCRKRGSGGSFIIYSHVGFLYMHGVGVLGGLLAGSAGGARKRAREGAVVAVEHRAASLTCRALFLGRGKTGKPGR
jgi:hypothetical protein